MITLSHLVHYAYHFIKSFFPSKIKKYSLTITDVKEGTDTKKDMSKEIKTIVNNLKKYSTISNINLNKLIDFYFNTKSIDNTLYTINKNYIDSMCFSINAINTVINKDNKDVDDIRITLIELTYGFDFNITISVKDFNELFNQLTLKL